MLGRVFSGYFLSLLFFFSANVFSADIPPAPTPPGSLVAGNTYEGTFTLTPAAKTQGLRIVLQATGSADLELWHDGSRILSETSTTGAPEKLKTLLLDPDLDASDLVGGDTYTVKIHADEDVDYNLFIEDQSTWGLSWDDGSEFLGTSATKLIQPNQRGGAYLFKITSPSNGQGAHGAWRFALDVSSGEANFFLKMNGKPTLTETYQSTNTQAVDSISDDGLVLDDSMFSANQNWYIRIESHAAYVAGTGDTGAQWQVYSGDVYVAPSPIVSDTPITLGPEGMAFFQATLDSATAGSGWRLRLMDGVVLPLLVEKNLVPVRTKTISSSTTKAHRVSENGELLLVTPYVSAGDYRVGVYGLPSASFKLDSGAQVIHDLGSDTSHLLDQTSNLSANEFGFITYKVNVPDTTHVWHLNVVSSVGDAQIAVRSAEVANDKFNTAYAETADADQIDLVRSFDSGDPGLTDGTWYVTVYRTAPGALNFVLKGSEPDITDVYFLNDGSPHPVITNDQPLTVGWRYYRVGAIDLPSNDPLQIQRQTLGWALELADQVAGTEINLRRTDVPGHWSRSYYTVNATTGAPSDRTAKPIYRNVFSDTGELSSSAHVPDQWVIGIYTPGGVALGAFKLTTRAIEDPQITFNGGYSTDMVGVPEDDWRFFKVVVPVPDNELLLRGWDLRLEKTASESKILGAPQMVVCRDVLPTSDVYETSFWDAPDSPSDRKPWTTTRHADGTLTALDHWPHDDADGYGCWAVGTDWTGRGISSAGDSEVGRVLIMGMGSPLEPGTYYIGVSDKTTGKGPMTYRLHSRGIGMASDTSTTWEIPVNTLNFTGSGNTVTVAATDANALPAREAAYYEIQVPTSQDSWSVEMNPLGAGSDTGEAMLVLGHGKLPNITAANRRAPQIDDPANHVGAKWQKGQYSAIPTSVMPGDEYVYKYANDGNTTITAGIYYVAVVGEGNNVTHNSRAGAGDVGYTLTSLGKVVVDEKLSPAVASATPVKWLAQSQHYGTQKAYRFRVSSVLDTLEIRLENITAGNPDITVYRSAISQGFIPDSDRPGYDANEGGQVFIEAHDTTITLQDPEQGDYTVLVAADYPLINPRYVDAEYELHAIATGPDALVFNGGSLSVSAKPGADWALFEVNVPAADTLPAGSSLLGWDIRIESITSGLPGMVVCRDKKPAAFDNDLDKTGALWPTNRCWAAAYYWNQERGDQYHILTMGMGSPLEPGKYIVGVSSKDTSSPDPLTYTIHSRGIGVGDGVDEDDHGNPWSIPVKTLNFTGSDSNIVLAEKEAAFYRIDVPTNMDSWAVELRGQTLNDEIMLAAGFGALPNTAASSARLPETDDASKRAGSYWKKEGNEYFYKYARDGESTLSDGSYYFAVISEGNNGGGDATFTLESKGRVIPDADTTPVAPNHTALWPSETLQFGEQGAYRFSINAGLTSLKVSLQSIVGDPSISLYHNAPGALQLIPDSYYTGSPQYDGNEGGQKYATNERADETITLSNPPAGDYTVLVTSNAGVNAGYDLKVTAEGLAGVQFNGNENAIVETGQVSSEWKYFEVHVPDDPNLLGWDIRLANVTSGRPGMVVCRNTDTLPNISMPTSLTTTNSVNTKSTWSEGDCWAAGDDWTHRRKDDASVDVSGRILAMGLGSPLSPGRYVVGVSRITSTATAPMTYTLKSRGIGMSGTTEASDGDAWDLSVANLAYGGSSGSRSVAVREGGYYKVTVPANNPGFALHLDIGGGHEGLLAVRKGSLPNISATHSRSYDSDSDSNYTGVIHSKTDQEFFYKYAQDGQASVPAGDYFVAVVGEGQNPPNTSQTGTGDVSYTLAAATMAFEQDDNSSHNPTVDASNEANWTSEHLDYGEQKAYQFTLAAGLEAVEISVGVLLDKAAVSLFKGSRIPDSYYTGRDRSYDANEGGQQDILMAEGTITLPEPVAGVYTLLVTSAKNAESNYAVTVKTKSATLLDFGACQWIEGNVLNNEQSDYYSVVIPGSVNGLRVSLKEADGEVFLRVRKDHLPEVGNTDTVSSELRDSILTAPYLSAGTWKLEIQAVSGNPTYDIRVCDVIPEASWSMPKKNPVDDPWAAGQPLEGLDKPLIGDTGNTDIEIGTEYFNFYKVVVPEDNSGLLYTELVGLGNFDLYLRKGLPPTLDSRASSACGPDNCWPEYFDRYHTGDFTINAGWVPLDNRVETQLTPGEWWIGVQGYPANGSYRLKVKVGGVEHNGSLLDAPSQPLMQDLAKNGGQIKTQEVSSGNTRYYRIKPLPLSGNEAGYEEWTVHFDKIDGQMMVFVRDTVPSGMSDEDGFETNCTNPEYFSDWADDAGSLGVPSPFLVINDTGDYTLEMPPVELGKTYYLGVYACGISSHFDIGSSVGTRKVTITGDLDFEEGKVDNETLAAGERRLYRIAVPWWGGLWKHASVPGASVEMYLMQGSLPPEEAPYDHWSSVADGTSLEKPLWGTPTAGMGPNANYPWQAGHDYYLSVVNTSVSPQTFSFTMEGTDDSEPDGLPDWWEYKYFNGWQDPANDPDRPLAQRPSDDPDHDGYDNEAEFKGHSDPTDGNSHPDTCPASSSVGNIDPVVTDHTYTGKKDFCIGTNTVTIKGVPSKPVVVESGSVCFAAPNRVTLGPNFKVLRGAVMQVLQDGDFCP